MPHTRIFPIVLAIGLVLLLQPVFGQKRKVDVRALWGYTAGLEDTPPHAWVGGGSVTAAVGRYCQVKWNSRVLEAKSVVGRT